MYQVVCVCVCAQSCLTLLHHGLLPARLLCTWNFPGKNAGAGCHFLFQGIFLTQGLNPRFLHLLHWQVGYLPLCCLGSPLGSLVPHNTNFKLAFIYSIIRKKTSKFCRVIFSFSDSTWTADTPVMRVTWCQQHCVLKYQLFLFSLICTSLLLKTFYNEPASFLYKE